MTRFSGFSSFAAEIPPPAVPEREGAWSVAESGAGTDEAAFRELYEETAPRLRAYLRRSCGDAALADDLLQETFYRFLRARLPGRERQRLRGYLYRIAASLVVDHWRRTERERRRDLAMPEEPATEAKQDTEAMRVFHQMKPQDQTLLWLAYVEGFDHREIAAAIKVREKSVRVLLFRARKRLEQALRTEGAERGGRGDQGSRQ